MLAERVEAAKIEAERFLKRVSEWEIVQGNTYTCGGYTFNANTPKENAAVKRASMDLTRALATLRR